MCSSSHAMIFLILPLIAHEITFIFCYQVDVCKAAYKQEDLDTAADSDVSPRDVGHNIYILAYQVSTLQSLYTVFIPYQEFTNIFESLRVVALS